MNRFRRLRERVRFARRTWPILEEAGFKQSFSRCAGCGNRGGVSVRGDERWCVICTYGRLAFETKTTELVAIFGEHPTFVAPCVECGRPQGSSHLGTCSRSLMRGGNGIVEERDLRNLGAA